MSSYSRGSYSRGYRGSDGSSGHRRYRHRSFGGGYRGSDGSSGRRRYRRRSPLQQILGRRSGMGCAVYAGVFFSMGATLAGLAWWIA